MGTNHRPTFNRFFKRVLVSDALPKKMGYYQVSFKRSKLMTDQLFVPEDANSEKLWKTQIEWWVENIDEPFAMTKEEALEKLKTDDEFVKIILGCYFVGREEKYRKPNQHEINLLKMYIKNSL